MTEKHSVDEGEIRGEQADWIKVTGSPITDEYNSMVQKSSLNAHILELVLEANGGGFLVLCRGT